MKDLSDKIAALESTRRQAKRYLLTLTGRDEPMAEFDPLAWQAIVHHATVEADRTITFTLRNGSEEKATVESGVRPYRKTVRQMAESCTSP